MKKSYNPFKMWLAWVGAIVGFLILLFGGAGASVGGLPATNTIQFAMFFWAFIGFLIGWGIHSLIRSIRK